MRGDIAGPIIFVVAAAAIFTILTNLIVYDRTMDRLDRIEAAIVEVETRHE